MRADHTACASAPSSTAKRNRTHAELRETENGKLAVRAQAKAAGGSAKRDEATPPSAPFGNRQGTTHAAQATACRRHGRFASLVRSLCGCSGRHRQRDAASAGCSECDVEITPELSIAQPRAMSWLKNLAEAADWPWACQTSARSALYTNRSAYSSNCGATQVCSQHERLCSELKAQMRTASCRAPSTDWGHSCMHAIHHALK